jgi:hypothetical protein
MLQQTRANGIANSVAGQEHPFSMERARAEANASLDPSTDVADYNEVEASLTNSFRTKSGYLDQPSQLPSRADIFLNERIHHANPCIPEPLRRSTSFNTSDSIVIKSRSAVSPEIVAQQLPIHWKERPIMPVRLAVHQRPTISQRSDTQSSSQIRIDSQGRLFSTSSSPMWRTRRLQSRLSGPAAQKRKAENVSGEKVPQSNPASSQPQKTTISPALRKTADIEWEMDAARARIAAACNRNLNLRKSSKLPFALNRNMTRSLLNLHVKLSY